MEPTIKKNIISISIKGFRGFSEEQTILISQPNGSPGSGLSVIVGANNSGKTSVIETLKSFGCSNISFADTKRSSQNVRLCLRYSGASSEITEEIVNVKSGSTTKLFVNGEPTDNFNNHFYVLDAYRDISHYFSKESYTNSRDIVTSYREVERNGSESNRSFNCRLNELLEKEDFNLMLERVLGYKLNWTIDENGAHNNYIKVFNNNGDHEGEGLGKGILSVIRICDSLYDSTSNSVICIDEPELSLHPAIQKRILSEIKRLSKDRQIIIATHSPYFVDWESILNGGSVIRVSKDRLNGSISIDYISEKTKTLIKNILEDRHNIHTLGLESKEVFFLEDNIILTEGQEDVFYYKMLIDDLSQDNDKLLLLKDSFLGWGSGGADNIMNFAGFLKELGFKHVCAIFDNDMAKKAKDFSTCFSPYRAIVIPCADVRDKDPRCTYDFDCGNDKMKKGKSGLFKGTEIKNEYRDIMMKNFIEILSFFQL